MDIIRLSFTKNFNWKFRISSQAKAKFMKFSVVCRLHQLFILPKVPTLYRACLAYMGNSIHTDFFKYGGVWNFTSHQIPSLLITNCVQFLPLYLSVFLFSTVIVMVHGCCSFEFDNYMSPSPSSPVALLHMTYYFLSPLICPPHYYMN